MPRFAVARMVTTITSSAPKVRNSSSSAVIGFGSPTSPTGHDLVFACPGQRTLEAQTRLRQLAVDVRHGVVDVGGEHGREHVDLDVLTAGLKD